MTTNIKLQFDNITQKDIHVVLASVTGFFFGGGEVDASDKVGLRLLLDFINH